MSGRPRTVLVVEDSFADFEVARRALEREEGLRLVWCRDGEEAFTFLSRCGRDGSDVPALVLLDLHLPMVDGRAVLARLKRDERLRHVPVVVLTTSDDPGDIGTCYAGGANSYVQKPFEPRAYSDALARTCDYWLRTASLPLETTHGR